jgi:hypothetical protein
MTEDEFKRLQVGDWVVHPAYLGFLTITAVETGYDYSTSPATLKTDSITADNGRLLKIGDTRDVALLRQLR